MNKYTYTQEQINIIVGNLNALNLQGMDNAKRLGIVAQTLDQAEIVEEKEEQKETEK
jgi:hypothetical protein